MRISEVMTAPAVTVTAETSIEAAAGLLASRRFTMLPVIDRTRALVGVVSEGDLVVDRFPVPRRTSGSGAAWPGPATVGEVMTTRGLVMVSPRDDTGSTIRRMLAARVRAVPVCDAGVLLGVVTLGDLVALVTGSGRRIPEPRWWAL